MLKIFEKDFLGSYIIIKRCLIGIAAIVTYSRFNILNKLRVSGTEHIKNLPEEGVLFVANHQTYYADVIALYHVFSAVKWGFKTINNPIYVLNPRVKNYYIAAEETMLDSGLLPKIFAYAGAVTVRRSWRHKGQEIVRGADVQAPEKIKKALAAGWVVNFPQGTTSPYAPVRKGTASIIQAYRPIVVPVVITGFRRAFDKKGLFMKKRGTKLSITFKEPFKLTGQETSQELLQMITKAIEQEPPQKKREE